MLWGGLTINAGKLARYLLVGGVLLGAFEVVPAEASTRTCRQIEAQLAALPPVGVPKASTRRYDDAITRQQQQLQKARGQANQAGCGRAIVGSAVAFCASVNGSIDKMQRNLADLQAKRAKLGRRDTRRERARLQASLDKNGCGTPPRRVENATVTARKAELAAPAGTTIGRVRGNFRTMCVRTCDGYYFPISNSVAQSGFARDQHACQAMCPGTEVELYIHRMPGQEAEDMVSATTGRSYRDLDSAFLYRKQTATMAPACSCSATAPASPSSFTVIGGEYREGSDETPSAAIAPPLPLPSARPDPADDPETLASREGGLDAEALKRLITPKPATPTGYVQPDAEKPIRVVGPTFLPDPEAAIDLQAPGPARAR